MNSQLLADLHLMICRQAAASQADLGGTCAQPTAAHHQTISARTPHTSHPHIRNGQTQERNAKKQRKTLLDALAGVGSLEQRGALDSSQRSSAEAHPAPVRPPHLPSAPQYVTYTPSARDLCF
eukprot:180850-Rhodomonas_salina.1